MNEFWSGFLGAVVGAAAAICAAWLTAKRQEAAEHRRWVRELKRQMYVDAVRSVAKATVVPIGTSIERMETWFRDLAIVRENLVTLQAHTGDARHELTAAISDLVSILDEFDFAIVATDAATLEAEGVNRTGLVLWGVASIRKALERVLPTVAACAKRDLGRDVAL